MSVSLSDVNLQDGGWSAHILFLCVDVVQRKEHELRHEETGG